MRDIRFELTKADFRELYFVQTWRKIWKFGLAVGILLTAWMALQEYCHCGIPSAAEILRHAIIGFGIALVSCALILALNTWAGSAMFEHYKRLGVETNLRWDEEHVHVQSQYATASYPWSLPCRWTETRSLLVIYLAEMIPLLIPKRAVDASEIEGIKTHLGAANVAMTPRFLF